MTRPPALPSAAPDVSPALREQAIGAARRLADSMDYVGVLCVEFFVVDGGMLVANEIMAVFVRQARGTFRPASMLAGCTVECPLSASARCSIKEEIECVVP